jgi:hypothetical protein
VDGTLALREGALPQGALGIGGSCQAAESQFDTRISHA